MASICKICNKDYKYPSKLKKHRDGAYGCKYTDITNITNIINNILQCNKCIKCNKLFKYKASLTRHINNVKCISNNIINNITNNGDINNGTINDNRQINITNNIIIQHINPFGHENTDFLTNKEKLEILRSGHKACIKILKIVYNRNENKNFYKVNKKSSTISYLKNNSDSNNASVDVFQLREFRKEIFNNSTTLLYSLMIDCKNDLCFEEQLALMDNITIIKNDVYDEIFNNSLSNLRKELGESVLDIDTKNEINWGIENVISYETDNINDKNRKQIVNYVNQINDEPIVKEIFKTQVTKQKEKRQTIKKELNDKSLYNNTDINEKYGKIEYGELANQLQLSHYPNTKFIKKINERENLEINIVKNNTTLGNLNSYNDIKKDRDRNIEHILKHENNIEKLKELSNNDELVIDHIISS